MKTDKRMKLYFNVFMCSNKHLWGLCQMVSCLVRAEALQPCFVLFNTLLSSVVFLPETVHSQMISPFAVASTHPPLCCPAVQLCSGQLFSVCILRRFTLRALHLYYKSWIPSGCTSNIRARTSKIIRPANR